MEICDAQSDPATVNMKQMQAYRLPARPTLWL